MKLMKKDSFESAGELFDISNSILKLSKREFKELIKGNL